MIERKEYIDISKGIGIFFIILVHLTVYKSVLSQILLSFCVAIFFFLSGVLYKERKNFKDFLCNLFNKLLVPLLIWGCLDFVFTIFWKYFIIGSQLNILEFFKMFLKIFFITGSANSNGPLWYLCTLFQIEIIFYPLISYKCKYKKFCQFFLLVFMFFIGYFIHFKGLFRLGQIPVSFVFFQLGFLFKEKIMNLVRGVEKKYLFFLLVIIFVIGCWINGFSELSTLNYGRNYFLYYTTALSMILAIILLSVKIQKNRILSFFGKNSLIIMCSHFYLTQYIIPEIFKKLNLSSALNNIFLEFIIALCISLVMIPIITIINKYFSILCGKYEINFFEKE